MALIPKKTYSRRNNELSVLSDKEKENVDPFDELLSSPLKQDVHFKPLSFWGEKVKRLESKGKSKKVDCGLFEGSDSDELNSPWRRKKKHNTESKARELQPKSRTHKLKDRRKNYSAYSCVKKTIDNAPVLSNKNNSFTSADEIGKHKACFLDRNLFPSEEILYSPHESCEIFEFNNIKCHLKKAKSVSSAIKNSNNTLSSVSVKENVKKKVNELNDVKYLMNSNSVGFKIYEDGPSEQQLNRVDNKTVILNFKEDSVNSTIQDNMDELPIQSVHHNFVSIRRHFNFPDCFNEYDDDFNATCISIQHNNSNRSPIQLWNEPKKSNSVIKLKFEDVSKEETFLGEINDETLKDDDTALNFLYCNESLDKTLCVGNFLSEEMSELECQEENTVSDNFDFMHLNDTELENLIQEIQIANLQNGVALESSSTSDDTLSSFNDEETVINVELKAKGNDSPIAGICMKKTDAQSVLNGVSVLTTGISDLSISNATGSRLSEPEVKKIENSQCYSHYEDTEKNSFSINLRNVRGQNSACEKKSYNVASSFSPKQERTEKETNEDLEFDQTFWIPGRKSLDWNKTICFSDPVFESTRVLDMSVQDAKKQTHAFENSDSILEETLSGLDRTYALKPGKKWQRSISVLKQIQNGSIAGDRLESTKITGRKYESFVRDLLEIHNEKSGFFTPIADITVSNKTVIGARRQNAQISRLSECKTVLESKNSSHEISEKFNADNSVFSNSLPNETVNEKTFFNHTVKVIQPEEAPSAFRSALGLDVDCSLPKEESVEDKSSVISARDFILLQCGQEDVLPFEEYFNERTLENCRKIGEGVYGEVFMCSNTVIKIIPIEGSDKVNGEPQKTFEEIISEVVIASKLSNLRRGKKHQTDGFSEMKRCWCVKGKYPKYLLKLWDEYDQLGSGSENDSPVMFKDDQLYIILELANGGKDLESFVFSSSAQSLSVFIQAAFSLAVAEKAFEFEHRDLHWGNVLISETKDKFVSVLLDGIEYKIPTKGVKVCIIDFTLSRINHEGCCIFNDLSVDPSLFASEGDYQFEIYRLMLREVKNDWSLFRPKTNIFWLHYTLDKMLKMVRYKNKKTKVHIKHLKDIKTLECVVLEHKDSTDFVLSDSLNDVMKKL